MPAIDTPRKAVAFSIATPSKSPPGNKKKMTPLENKMDKFSQPQNENTVPLNIIWKLKPEYKFVSDMFDKYDKNNNGILDAPELTPMCLELNVRPWHVFRHVKMEQHLGKVTKKAFLNYWFELDPAKRSGTPGKSAKKRAGTPSAKRTHVRTPSSTRAVDLAAEYNTHTRALVANSKIAVKIIGKAFAVAVEEENVEDIMKLSQCYANLMNMGK